MKDERKIKIFISSPKHKYQSVVLLRILLFALYMWGSYLVLRELKYTDMAAVDKNSPLFLSMFSVGVLLFLILAYGMIRRGSVLIPVIAEASVLFLGIRISMMISEVGISLMAAAVGGLVVIQKQKGGWNKKIVWDTAMWAGVLITIVFILTSYLTEPALYLGVKIQENINDIRNEVGDYINRNHMFSSGITSWGNYISAADGSLNKSMFDKEEKTALKVTLSHKPLDTVYLRGFTGDSYERSYWHKSDGKEFRKYFMDPKDGQMAQNIMCGHLERYQAPMDQEAKVERINPGGNYGYVPYGFQVPDDENVYYDSYYKSRNKENTFYGCVNWNQWMEEESSATAYSTQERMYMDFVAQEYLKVPVYGIDRLKEYCSSMDFQSVQEVLDFVIPMIRNTGKYDLTVGDIPKGKDFVENFFFDEQRGYCIHYASTAVLMLRMFGVPARYVTGYVAFAKDFVEQDGRYVAEISNQKAHAWVEVYRKGKGWIPIEVTPGYDTISQENSTVNQEKQPVLEEKKTATEETETRKEEETAGQEKIPDSETKNEKHPWWMAVVILCLAAVGTALPFIHKGYKKWDRKRRFYQKDKNEAVKEISYELAAELGKKGIRPEGCEEMEYGRKVEELVPDLEKGEYTEFIRIAQKASYSREKIRKKEFEYCIAVYHKLIQK